MKNNFSRIARVYDFIGRIVFGTTIRKAQTHFFDQIKAGESILIVGGGTGWILQELESIGKNLHVVYIDLSTEMIKAAQQRIPYDHLDVDFIQGSQNDIPNGKFDIVVTHFFLDVFSGDHLPMVMKKIDSHLKDSGLWLCADFIKSDNIWKILLLKLMHWFFQIMTNLESKELQNFERAFKNLGFKKVHSELYYHQMIETSVYRKPKVM